MGLFLQTVLFPGGEGQACRAAVQQAAEDMDLNIQPDECRWRLYEKGPAVLMNDGCCGYGDLAEKLSGRLPCPVLVLFIHDDDYWGYFLWKNGAELNQFHSLPDYFGRGNPPRKPADAALMAQTFGVEREAIENYLLPWEEEQMGNFAYEGDAFAIGDCWQMAGFMAALGFDYDLLDPQPEEPEEPEEPPAPPPRKTFTGYIPYTPLPESEELPNAVTDQEYALSRAEEVLDVAGEAVQFLQDMEFTAQYRDAAELFTAAIQAHPERAALYILRSFCWNQMEGLPSGRSRKPDMDRDMTKVLELEPDNVMALRARCPTAGTTTRYQRHIQDLTRLLELDPDHWDNYLTSRAYRFHWVGDDASARADLEKLVRRGAPPTVDLGYLLREFGMM